MTPGHVSRAHGPCERNSTTRSVRQAHGMQSRVRDRLRHDCHVDLVAKQTLEHDSRVVDSELEGERSCFRPECRHDRHDVMGAVGSDAQMSARERLLAGQECLRLVRRANRRSVMPWSCRPVSVGTTCRPRRVEEPYAIGIFQRRHLARQVWIATVRSRAPPRRRIRISATKWEGAELAGCHIHETDRWDQNYILDG